MDKVCKQEVNESSISILDILTFQFFKERNDVFSSIFLTNACSLLKDFGWNSNSNQVLDDLKNSYLRSRRGDQKQIEQTGQLERISNSLNHLKWLLRNASNAREHFNKSEQSSKESLSIDFADLLHFLCFHFRNLGLSIFQSFSLLFTLFSTLLFLRIFFFILILILIFFVFILFSFFLYFLFIFFFDFLIVFFLRFFRDLSFFIISSRLLLLFLRLFRFAFFSSFLFFFGLRRFLVFSCLGFFFFFTLLFFFSSFLAGIFIFLSLFFLFILIEEKLIQVTFRV